MMGTIEAGGRVAVAGYAGGAAWPWPSNTDCELFAFEVTGDDQGCRFEPGDVVYFARPPKGNWPAFIGSYCACRLASGETVLALLQAGSAPSLFSLRLPSGDSMPDQTLVWVAPMHWRLSPLLGRNQ